MRVQSIPLHAICDFIRECDFESASLKITTRDNYGAEDDPDISGEKLTNVEKEFYFKAPNVRERLITKLQSLKPKVSMLRVALYTDEWRITIDNCSFEIWIYKKQSQEAMKSLFDKMIKCDPHQIKILKV